MPGCTQTQVWTLLRFFISLWEKREIVKNFEPEGPNRLNPWLEVTRVWQQKSEVLGLWLDRNEIFLINPQHCWKFFKLVKKANKIGLKTSEKTLISKFFWSDNTSHITKIQKPKVVIFSSRETFCCYLKKYCFKISIENKNIENLKSRFTYPYC